VNDKAKSKMTIDEVKKKLSKHFLREHVGKTDKELRARLRIDLTILANSTFKDSETAIKVIKTELNNNTERIDKWVKNAGGLPYLQLNYQGENTEILGRGIKRGMTTVKDQFHAIIILQKDKASYIVLTAHPI
jgi:hypothetical protein